MSTDRKLARTRLSNLHQKICALQFAIKDGNARVVQKKVTMILVIKKAYVAHLESQ